MPVVVEENALKRKIQFLRMKNPKVKIRKSIRIGSHLAVVVVVPALEVDHHRQVQVRVVQVGHHLEVVRNPVLDLIAVHPPHPLHQHLHHQLLSERNVP